MDENIKVEKLTKKNKVDKRKIIILWVILILSLGIGAAYKYDLFNKVFDKDNTKISQSDNKLDTSISGDVSDGELKLDDSVKIKNRLQEKTDNSYNDYKINVNPVFKDGQSLGKLYIENSSKNKNILQVEILDANTKKLMYKSPAIKPNQSIEKGKLVEDFPKGEYDAIAMFNNYDLETQAYAGSAGIKIKIKILN